MAIELPIQRFRCCECGRAFSWRPAFLVFGRSYIAVAYQKALQAMALNQRLGTKQAWYELSRPARRAFRRYVMRRLDRLLSRLEYLAGVRPLGLNASEAQKKHRLWTLASVLAQRHSSTQQELLPAHIVSLALARSFRPPLVSYHPSAR